MSNQYLLHTAAVELAARCNYATTDDGMGFNKPDSYMGHFAASVPFEHWSSAMRVQMWHMLRTYKRQLENYGIDYDAIEVPEGADDPALAQKRIAKRLLDFDKGEFVFDFDFDTTVIGAVKDQIPGRYFERGAKVWRAPGYEAEAIADFAARYGFYMTEAAQAAVENRPARPVAADEAPAPKAENGTEITYDAAQGLFIVAMPYKAADLREAVKAIPGRKFDWDNKVWTVPEHRASDLADVAREFGIAMPGETAEVIESAPAAERIEIDGDGFAVYFDYDPALVAAVKEIEGRTFLNVPGNKRWHVPGTSAEQLLRFAQVYGFAVAPEVLEALRAHIARLQENLEASRALDGQYHVPGLAADVELYPFQQIGVKYMVENKGLIQGDPMGTGKTYMALAAVQAAGAFPALVIVPASVKVNWQRKALELLPGKTVMIVNGRKQMTGYADSDIVVINYDIIGAHVAELEKVAWQAVIADEAHKIKNRKTKRGAAVTKLMQKAEYRFAMTGTAVDNYVRDLRNLLEAIGKFKAIGGWRYFKRFHYGSYTAEDLLELNRRLRSAGAFLRREKEVVLPELPPLTRNKIVVPIDNREEYNRAAEDIIAWLEENGEPTTAAQRAEALVRIEKLKQLAWQGKKRHVKEWIRNFLRTGEKLIVFATHQEAVKELAAEFDGSMIIGGQTSAKRQEVIDGFQAGEKQLVVANLNAGGEGITLTAASHVLTVEYGWKPGEHDQAEARAWRLTQEADKVMAHYMIGEWTIDGDIIRLIEKKRKAARAAMDGTLDPDAAGSILGDLIGSMLSAHKGE